MTTSVIGHAFINLFTTEDADAVAGETGFASAVSRAGNVSANRFAVTKTVSIIALVDVGATGPVADAAADVTGVAGARARAGRVGAGGAIIAASVVRLAFVYVRTTGRADAVAGVTLEMEIIAN